LNRELQEELGIQVRVEEKIGVYEHAYTHFRVTLHAFKCHLIEGMQPVALEHRELRWVAPSDLSGLPMGKLDRQIAGALLEMGEKNRTVRDARL
jgi:A/G-specific adenine glycosylase